MTLRTGSKGFTLVEVMVAVAVLSLGAVLVYEAFFISLDSFDYCSDYLNIAPWMDEKIRQVQDSFRQFGPEAVIATSGDVVKNKRRFKWDISNSVIGATEGFILYHIELVLYAKRGEQDVKLSRNAYAIAEYETETEEE